MKTERVVYFDVLRIVSVFSVIMIHVAAQNWYFCSVDSYEWNVFNFFDSLVRWAVPIYVMISGALFLGKTQPIKKIYFKNIMSILIKLLFWSSLYGLWEFFIVKSFNSKIDLLNVIVSGHYHLWFLYMIIGLYMIIPFLNKIVEDKNLAFYFLLLSFVYSFLLPQLISIIELFNKDISLMLNNVIFNTKMHFVLGYSGYYILGYLLNNIEINKKQEIIIYILGLFGFIITFTMTAFFSHLFKSPKIIFYENMSVNVLLVSISVFVFAKYHIKKVISIKNIQSKLVFISKCSLGAYLVHPIFIDSFDLFFHINTLSYNPVFLVPLLSLVIFILSFLISIIINKIPFFKKCIV